MSPTLTDNSSGRVGLYGAMTFINRGVLRLSEPKSPRELLVKAEDRNVLEADSAGTGITNSFDANDSERAGLVTRRGSSTVGITKKLSAAFWGIV